MRRRTRWLAGIVLGAGALTCSSWAPASPPDDDRVGDQESALPGLVRVGMPVAQRRGVRVGGSAGYGLTEGVGDAAGPHHRIHGSVALGAVVTSWLQLGGRLDGRVDLHPNDPDGADSGAVGDPRLLARAGTWVSDSFALGAEVGLWVPGANAPSFELDATTLDAAALVAWNASPAWTLAARAGYRLDNSANSVADPDRLRAGDRLALGVSDSDAVLAAAGASFRHDSLEIIGEVSADLLMGGDAPTIGESPMRVTAGARYHVSHALQVGALAEASPSARPDISPGAPLVPVEPRVGARATLVYRFGAKPAVAPPPPEAEKPDRIEPEPDEAPDGAPEPTPAQPTAFIVRLKDRGGDAVGKAWVRVETPDGQPITLKPDEEAGTYRAETIPPGKATLVVTADGFADLRQPMTFAATDSGDPMEASIELEPSSSRGQIRGLIRSFSGKPIEATIEIAPLQKTAQTNSDGTFTVDVPPDSYTVTIRAAGYRSQTRRVRVDHDGVVVLNAELLESR